MRNTRFGNASLHEKCMVSCSNISHH
jgi:hypothetical protein